MSSWETRTAPTRGWTVDRKTGEQTSYEGTVIYYRKKGSRGRWLKFTVLGPAPGSPEELVDAYEQGLL